MEKKKNFRFKGNSVEEMIIKEVSKPGREVLYDWNHPQIKNNAAKLIIWKKIAAAIGITKEDCQRTWRSLKKRYVAARIKKDSPNGRITPYREWILQEMQFAESYIKDVKPTISELKNQRLQPNKKNTKNDDGQNAEDLDFATSLAPNNNNLPQQKKIAEPTKNIVLCFSKSNNLEKGLEQRNEDDIFGIFISKELAKVTAGKQNELKMKLLELVFEYQKF